MITYDDYMKGYSAAQDQSKWHNDFYDQLVNDMNKSLVKMVIGEDRIVKSKDPHFNDIPLKLWDIISFNALKASKFREFGLPYSLSTGVCLAKACARQIKEEHDNESN